MANESIRVEMTADEWQKVVQSTLTAAINALATCHPIDQLVTVDDRCRERWPTATKKNKRRIRDVFVGMYRERLGRHPLKLTGHLNGTIAVEREHLATLDHAIDIVKDEVEGRESLPLFSPRAR
jgi:hypothetical protein